MRLREIRLQSDRPLRRGDGLVYTAKGAIDRAKIGQRFDIIRFDGDCASDQIRRGFVVAALVRNQSEMMQAEVVLRLDAKHLCIDFFRRALAPGAIIFERQRQQILRGGRRP